MEQKQTVDMKNTAVVERVMLGFIVFAASVSVGMITLYLYMFDASPMLR